MCHGIGRGTGHFMKVSVHNLFDAMSAIVDIAFLFSKLLGGNGTAAFAAAAVGIRMLRLSRFVMPVDAWYKAICRRFGVEELDELDSKHLPFEIFRRCVSAFEMYESVLDVAWPMPVFLDAFLRFDTVHGIHTAAFRLGDLEDALQRTGCIPTNWELLQMKCILSEDGSPETLVYFEDFVDVLRLVHDDTVETAYLRRFEEPRHRTGRTLMYTFVNVFRTLASIVALFALEVMAFATNIYVLASSSVEDIDELEVNLRAYALAMAVSIKGLPNWVSIIMGLGAQIMWGFYAVLLKFSTYFTLNVEIIEGGVTCEGVQSLVYLPIIYVIVAIVIVLFDSSACKSSWLLNHSNNCTFH